MSSGNPKLIGSNVIEALATAGISTGIDIAIFKIEPNYVLLMKGGVSAGSDFVGSSVTDMLIPYLAKWSSSGQAASKTYLGPVVSGGVYVLADSVIKFDPRPMITKFLIQAGSSAGAAYLVGPVRLNIIGGSASY